MSENPHTLGGDLMLGAGPLAVFLFGNDSPPNKRRIYRLAEARALGLFKLEGHVAGFRSTVRAKFAQLQDNAGKDA
jgi:hypothetical protein